MNQEPAPGGRESMRKRKKKEAMENPKMTDAEKSFLGFKKRADSLMKKYARAKRWEDLPEDDLDRLNELIAALDDYMHGWEKAAKRMELDWATVTEWANRFTDWNKSLGGYED
jgi:hypothetical protein